MNIHATPPRSAEALLMLAVRDDRFQSVAGDLLEDYRERVQPSRGQRLANIWYWEQVLGFVMRACAVWAVLFGAAYVIRMALDWFAPPADFVARSLATTLTAGVILAAAGLTAGWRTRSFLAGAAAGVATTGIAAIISIGGISVLLAVWHDPQTMSAVQGSGGLEESYSLPIMAILPGLIIGTVAGILGVGARKVLRA